METTIEAISEYAWLIILLSFVVVFIETAGLPIPALTFALFAAMLAGQGAVDFFAVWLAVVLGGVIGGPVGYWLGKRGGRPLVQRIGDRVKITPDRIEAADEHFQHRGNLLVTGRYFVPILPWAAGLFSGIVHMPRGRFIMLNALSIVLWASIEMTLVALFGSAIQDFLGSISVTTILVLVFGVIGLIALIRLFRRRQSEKAELPQQAAAESAIGEK